MAIVANTNLTPWQLRPLASDESSSRGYTHTAQICANDLTASATTQTLILNGLKIGDVIAKVATRVKTPFTGGGLTTMTMSVGNTGSATAYTSAQNVFTSGTVELYMVTAIQALTATTNLTVLFTGSGNVVLATVGEIEIFVQLIRASELELATTPRTLTK